MGDEKIDVIINEQFKDILGDLEKALSSLKDVMTIPVERLQDAMTKDGFVAYCKIRSVLLETFPLVELLVGSADDEVRCMSCGKPAELSTINGKTVLKGEVTHWIENGRVVHDYTCDECIKRNK